MKDKKIIESIRAFNRYYTDLIGLLDDHLLNSDYSLVEARTLYEVYSHQPVSASQIMAEIHIDKGYLSRILKQFEKKGIISKEISDEDARITLVSLTEKGTQLVHELNDTSNQQIGALIKKLTKEEQQELLRHMQAIRELLGKH
ncbi:MarR family winged helix-turn-helix transcriptional regulator [Chitinophaga pinensis]|uniref:Transcriptional regulator, MarR family n=1 Tax=Chitinophaga pinensis (strain ATCC 43595 / DSM 2588 / LMG 13176 / NBRC 15968 / NCIMB 11800 / UQM 2034) TaxID=485918 RepID=A0A979G3X9_CHIPD|nr:MarR family transcriptional regulator [Chitinophaga pinensis]ACU60133.1 transcriptional regulator, MarR family [Chitinophaga pinensis DSM 2588]